MTYLILQRFRDRLQAMAAIALLAGIVSNVDAEGSSAEAKDSVGAGSSSEAVVPLPLPLQRYQPLIERNPFGKVPPIPVAPTPKPAPKPKDRLIAPNPEAAPTLALAGTSALNGKPSVYLIDLETRSYQKAFTDSENAQGIILLDVDPATHPRDASARISIDGRTMVVRYDASLLERKAKRSSAPARKPIQGQPVSPAVSRSQHFLNTKPPALVAQATAASSAFNGHSDAPPSDPVSAAIPPSHVNLRSSSTSEIPPLSQQPAIQDTRRLSTVPRRRVVVPDGGVAAPPVER